MKSRFSMLLAVAAVVIAGFGVWSYLDVLKTSQEVAGIGDGPIELSSQGLSSPSYLPATDITGHERTNFWSVCPDGTVVYSDDRFELAGNNCPDTSRRHSRMKNGATSRK